MKEQGENHRKPADHRTRSAKDQETTGPSRDRTRTKGPGGQRACGPEGTKGPREQGTKGPMDQRTKGSEDLQTTGPGEQQKTPIKEFFGDPLLPFFWSFYICWMLFIYYETGPDHDVQRAFSHRRKRGKAQGPCKPKWRRNAPWTELGCTQDTNNRENSHSTCSSSLSGI